MPLSNGEAGGTTRNPQIYVRVRPQARAQPRLKVRSRRPHDMPPNFKPTHGGSCKRNSNIPQTPNPIMVCPVSCHPLAIPRLFQTQAHEAHLTAPTTNHSTHHAARSDDEDEDGADSPSHDVGNHHGTMTKYSLFVLSDASDEFSVCDLPRDQEDDDEDESTLRT